MVRHDHELVHRHTPAIATDRSPLHLHGPLQSGVVKKTLPLVRADGDEIRPVTRVVVTAKADRMPVMNFGVVPHIGNVHRSVRRGHEGMSPRRGAAWCSAPVNMATPTRFASRLRRSTRGAPTLPCAMTRPPSRRVHVGSCMAAPLRAPATRACARLRSWTTKPSSSPAKAP